MSARRITVAATNTAVPLGDASSRTISRWVLAISGTLTTVSILPKGTVTPSGGETALTAVNIPYMTVIAQTTLIDPGSTAITATGIYVVPADGLYCTLSVTITAGGPVYIDAVPLYG